MTDRPARWPETPDIVTRLRSRREAWTCIRDEAASEIEKLRAEVRQWMATAAHLDIQCAEWCAENNAMRAVTEAAVLYCTTGQDRGGEKLLDAVAAYREMKK
jgi:hypothetical protein